MMWTYRASGFRVIDGDTLVLEVDLGLRVTITQTVRVAGVNAPERNSDAGQAARRAVVTWLAEAEMCDDNDTTWPLTITTSKPAGGDKYGRWLASISRADGRDLATDMIAAGHAVAWDGHGPKPVAS